MSWDSYIDNLIEHTGGNGDAAAIIGLDGSIWTSQAHAKALKITQEEASKIATAMKKKEFSVFQAGGIRVADVKYQFLRGDENIVLGKKKGEGAITLQSTKTAVVIGHTAEGQQQGNVNKGVSTVAEYLEGLAM